ncbi:MAG: hypothetical protein BWY83_02572 [bacterium ADurb.Bin478]|nr:MAG: hypothetical protein BWY83_02572 [bacterium ADurb.Bin478]
MSLGIVVQNHAGVEQVFRIQQLFDLPHDVIRFFAPFELDKRRHVAAGAVLPFERTVVFFYHQGRHLVHKPAVPFHLRRPVEILFKDEMQTSFQGVAEDDGVVVAMAGKQGLKIQHRFSQTGNRKSDILDDDRCSGLAHGADGWKQTFADVPQPAILVQLPGKGGGNHGLKSGQSGLDLLEVYEQAIFHWGARFHQQSGNLLAQGFQIGGHAGLIFHRAQRGPVHQFHGTHRALLHGGHRPARLFDVRKDHQRRCFFCAIRNRQEGDLADEAKRPLRADHQMFDDFNRIVKIQQRIEAIAHRIFHFVFTANPGGQLGIVAHPLGQSGNALQQISVARLKRSDRVRVAGVEQSAVAQDQTQGGQGMIAVLFCAAAHAAGVIDNDAADHGRVDGGRIRADLSCHGRQGGIGRTAQHTGLHADSVAVVQDLDVLPPLIQHHQDRIGDRLAGQAGSGCAKGERQTASTALAQDQLDFALCFRLHHQFGQQAVKAGVGAKGQSAEIIVQQA